MALKDLFQIGSSKRVLKSQWKTDGVPFYRGREVTRLAMDGIVDNELFISETHYADLAKQYGVPRAGDIVITAIGTIGNSYIVQDQDKFYFKDASVLWMKKNCEISSQFINYWLKSPQFFDQLDHGNGATVDTLTIQKLQSLQISVPPASEQHHIVAILDEAFDALATAKVNAEKKLKNARELLEISIRQSFDALGECYESRLLGSVCKFENGDRGQNYPGKEHRVAQGIPFINAGHLTPMGIDFAEMDYISPERFALLGNGKIQPLDVLFCLRGSLGKYASVGDISCGAIASSLVILRSTMELNHEYLLCYLGSSLCAEQIEAYKGGAAQPNLGAKDLKKFAIPLPPIGVQRMVSERIMELQDRTSDLLSLTTKKLAALDDLKKSLLHQAFNGELSQ